MAEQKEVPKKKAKAEGKMTVKSYQQGINVEKQKMGAYSKKFGHTVNQFKGEIKTATKKMNDGVDKLKGDIEDQIKENKTAVAHIASNIKYFLGEINKKKKDFKSYAVSFWGVSE